MSEKRQLALLIDGDNAQYKRLPQIIEVIKAYGVVTDGRAYGDWTKPNLANWKPLLLEYAIHPILQIGYISGKNATDIALVIDAMDILHKGAVQGFVIVSSDSDYTRLCMRIREEGLFMMGIGNKQAPDALIRSCDVFFRVEEIYLRWLLYHAFAESPKDNRGWARLGEVGRRMQQRDPDFDIGDYGFSTLTGLIELQTNQLIVDNGMVNQSNHVNDRALEIRQRMLPLLIKALDKAPKDGKGWTTVALLQQTLHHLIPDFSPRICGYTTLGELIASYPWQFVIEDDLVKLKQSQDKTQLKDQYAGNKLMQLLYRAFEMSEQQDDGWVHLGALGNALRDLDPNFDSRTYGHKSLSLLVKSLPQYITVKGAKKNGPSIIYVRMKN